MKPRQRVLRGVGREFSMGGVHDAVDSQRFPAWEEDYIRPPFRQLARTLRIGKVTGGRGRETRDRRRARPQRRHDCVCFSDSACILSRLYRISRFTPCVLPRELQRPRRSLSLRRWLSFHPETRSFVGNRDGGGSGSACDFSEIAGRHPLALSIPGKQRSHVT